MIYTAINITCDGEHWLARYSLVIAVDSFDIFCNRPNNDSIKLTSNILSALKYSNSWRIDIGKKQMGFASKDRHFEA